MNDVVLEAAGLTKAFGGIPALREGSLTLRRGSIVGLVGENGAGKSTLLGILSGNLRPDSGRLEIGGHPVAHFSPAVLLHQHRVALVPQEIDLVLDRSVAQNVLLGREGGILPNGRVLRREAQMLCARVGLELDVTRDVRGLSPSEQQLVLVARALGRNSEVLLFDEPTANLTPPEAARLHALMHQLTSEGASIVYVSHHLHDVLGHCEQIVVMRDGAVRAVYDSSVDEDVLVSEMIGRERTPHRRSTARSGGRNAVEFVAWSGERFGPVSTTLAGGSVVGLAGLPTSGRSELLRAIMVPRRTSGEVRVDGVHLRLGSPKAALLNGIGYVPPERRAEGVFLELPVADNIAVLHIAGPGRGLWDSPAARRRRSRTAFGLAGIAGRLDQSLRELSGGNQQKAVLARSLDRPLRLLILDEPTRGVDIEAKRAIHGHVQRLAEGGCTVLVSSSDVPELLELCDRILVLRDGAIVADLDTATADEEAVLAPALRSAGRASAVLGEGATR